MKSNAYLTAIEYELPIRVLDNQHLAAEYPDWTADKIYAKTGIRERHIVSSTDFAYRFNWKYTYNQRPLHEWSRYFSFRLKAVPDIFSKLLETAHVSVNDIVSFVFHQANRFMLEHIQKIRSIRHARVFCFEGVIRKVGLSHDRGGIGNTRGFRAKTGRGDAR